MFVVVQLEVNPSEGFQKHADQICQNFETFYKLLWHETKCCNFIVENNQTLTTLKLIVQFQHTKFIFGSKAWGK